MICTGVDSLYNDAMRKVIFLASPDLWQLGHGPDHPLKPERLKRTYELLQEYGALEAPNVQVIAPRQASEDELSLFHTEEYVTTVRALSSGDTSVPPRRHNFGPGDNPVFAGMFESGGLKVGSALLGAESLLSGACDVAFSYSGGMHHAGPDFASGFCIFNDAAVAIHWLLRQGLRVAYVDIDVHHGDGVQAAFYDTNQVLTISLHQDGRTLFPGTGFVNEIGHGAGTGYSVNVPLPPNTDDETYLWAFHQIVPPLLTRFEANIVVTQLGVDTHYLDPLASLVLTTHAHARLFRTLNELAPRWLALGGGGYNLDVVPRAWTLAFSIMTGLSLPEELPPGYRAGYGGRWLKDQGAPHLSERSQRMTHDIVSATVTKIKELHKIA